MPLGMTQRENNQLVRLMSSNFQPRYESNFAWKSVCSDGLVLPLLRAFWPMSSTYYTLVNMATDVSAHGFHLNNDEGVQFGYENLIPYAETNGGNYLARLDGGVGNWADITGTELWVPATQRGVTLGGWFKPSRLTNQEELMSKWGAAGVAAQSFLLEFRGDIVNDPVRFRACDGVATGTAAQTFGAAADTWYFFAGRYDISSQDGTVFAGYYNGQLDSTTVNFGLASINDSATDFYVGAQPGGAANQYAGRMSLLFLCAASLSNAIISCFFHQTRAMFNS